MKVRRGFRIVVVSKVQFAKTCPNSAGWPTASDQNTNTRLDKIIVLLYTSDILKIMPDMSCSAALPIYHIVCIRIFSLHQVIYLLD